jgi:uncharacterized protein DUF4296
VRINTFIFKSLVFIFIGIFVSQCGNKANNSPENIIPKGKMIELLTDIHIFDAVMSEKKYNTKKHEYQIEGYYSYLYEKHGYTRAQIDSSISFYSRDPEEYSKMYDDVLEKLSTIQSYYEKKDTIK